VQTSKGAFPLRGGTICANYAKSGKKGGTAGFYKNKGQEKASFIYRYAISWLHPSSLPGPTTEENLSTEKKKTDG